MSDYEQAAEVNEIQTGRKDGERKLQDEINVLKQRLQIIESFPGCECDWFNGHVCSLCKIREIARGNDDS